MATSQPPSKATLVDRAYQLAYWCAYRVMRTYWQVQRPITNGALVAIWANGEVLLVRNSYVSYYSAPGGYLRAEEGAREAALRELAEEVGIFVRPEQLELAGDTQHAWEGKRDHVQIFTLVVQERPQVRIDHREVVEASWFTPAQVANMNVFPPLKQAILRRAAG